MSQGKLKEIASLLDAIKVIKLWVSERELGREWFQGGYCLSKHSLLEGHPRIMLQRVCNANLCNLTTTIDSEDNPLWYPTKGQIRDCTF